MTTKISGFVLSPFPSEYVPLVNPEIKKTVITGQWGTLTLYAINEDLKPVSPNVWSLGFPPHSSLLDHNLLITIKEDQIIIENDWMAGIPVYYNTNDKIVSTFPEICLGKSPEFDEEGLYLYLKYGFAALGTTPFHKVFTLRYFSSLKYSLKQISVDEKEDPALSADLSEPASEDEIWELLRDSIYNVMDKTSGPVVSPLSGGLDSRIINALVAEKHKSRIRTYSYGVSVNQEKSFESQIAKRVARKLGLQWKHIYLNDAYQYMDEWHDLFGFGTHLHGMIHIEFYRKILRDISPDQPSAMFSGISGSAFQGGYPAKKRISRPSELYDLALTHHLNCNRLIDNKQTQAETRFFESNRELLTNLRWYPVVTMRIKMNLLHYLYKLPATMGLPSTSPYHNFEIATKMLSLPMERRKNRRWVNEYFLKKNLYFGSRIKYGDTRNTLNQLLFKNHTFQPLDEKIWEKNPVRIKKVREINENLKNADTPLGIIRFYLTTLRVVKELVKLVGIYDIFSKYLPPYLTLKSLEKTLKKRKVNIKS